MNKLNQRKNGYALYYAIVLTGILILVAYVTANISIKELALSTAAGDSHTAFYNADTGLECALYWDLQNPGGTSAFSSATPGSISCNSQTLNNIGGGGGTGGGTFTAYRSITIDHAKVGTVNSTDQSSFPVLISGTYAYLANTSHGGKVQNANGYDIIFTSDSGCATPLSWEVENYNSTSGEIEAWVKVPSVSHTSDTSIYMCYGSSSISGDQSNPAGVWNNGYSAVYHLPSGSPVSISDSLGANSGTNSGGTITQGKIAGGIDFSGNGHATLPRSIQDDMTMSTWFKTTSAYGGAGNLWYSGLQLVSAEMCGVVNDFGTAIGGGSVQFGIGNPDMTIYSPSTYNDGNWHYMTATRVKSSGALALYVDGVQVATGTGNTNSLTAPSNIYLANDPCGAPSNFPGQMDEVRLSTTARSADWIKTEYNNQSAPDKATYGASGFYTVGSETVPSGGGSGGGSSTTITQTVSENGTASLTCSSGTILSYTSQYGSNTGGSCPVSCGTCTIGGTSCSVTYNNALCGDCNSGFAKNGDLSLTCGTSGGGGGSGGGTSTFQLNLSSGCAVVTVTKSGGGTSIESKGYNVCSGSHRLERGIEIQY
jgi:hypothetical protein